MPTMNQGIVPVSVSAKKVRCRAVSRALKTNGCCRAANLLAAANDECGTKRLVDDEAASESEVTAVGSQEIEGDASAKSKSPKKKKKEEKRKIDTA